MPFEIDQSLDWPDHFVEHGFCVIKKCVSEDFCRRGIEAFQQALGTDLPPRQWSTQTIAGARPGGRVGLKDDHLQQFLDSVYDQPGIQQMLATMFGGFENWSGQRAAQPFLCVFDPDNPRKLSEGGHVDFVEVRIPIIGDGFVFQTSLIDTEPFSGNITISPGWHKILQKKLLEDPDYHFGHKPEHVEAWRELMPPTEVYEFVAEAGDVLLMHHLVGHQGNSNAAEHHTPRVAIHAHATASEWANEIDPDDPEITPHHRSLAHNGPIKLPYDEREVQAEAYRQRAARKDDPTKALR